MRRSDIHAPDLDLYLQSDLPASRPLTSDMTPVAAAMSLLASNLTKKLVNTKRPPKDAVKKALEKFLENDLRCAKFSMKVETLMDEYILGEAKSILDDFFHPQGLPLITLGELTPFMSLGKGMNVGSKNEAFLTKAFFCKLTSTSKLLYRLYCMAISSNPKWASAEKQRMSIYGLRIVRGSTWTPVPKTIVVARGVATEPTVNMFFQRGIGTLIECRLESYFGIKLDTQPTLNQMLALEGSMSGYFSTIDLSDASDSISLTLAKALLPAQVFRWLELTRSPAVVLPDGSSRDLSILSTMGNGYTFALQTAIFAALSKAVLRLSDKVIGNTYDRVRKTWWPGNYGVYGDDIIVPTRVCHAVLRTLVNWGFKPNAEKTFSSGSFRESCGKDYFKGVDVRSVYIEKLTNPQQVYSAINRLFVFQAIHDVYLENTMNFLLSKVRYLPVPFSVGDTSGLKVPSSKAFEAYDPATRSQVFRGFEPVPSAVDLTRSTRAKKKLGYSISTNPDAVLTSFCGGYIRDGHVVLPTRGTTRFKVRWSVIPYWDWIPQAVLTKEQGERWKALLGKAIIL